MISRDAHGECEKQAWDIIEQEYMYPGGIMTLYDHPVAQMPLNQFLCTIFSFIEMQWVCRCGSGSESGEGGRLDVRLPQVCAVHSHSQKCSEHIFVLVATP